MKILILTLFFFSFLFSSDFEYFIQVGSAKKSETLINFKEIANENQLNYIIRAREKNDVLFFRILIGPYKTKEEAKSNLDDLKRIFQNKSSYISKFKKNNTKIEKIKRDGYEAFLNREFLTMNKLLEEAATLGDKESIYFIARNYHHAIGIKQDTKKAIFWYEKCQDDNRCLIGLGNIYLDYTLDLKPDLEKAFYYIKKASKNGSKKAKVFMENRDSIENMHSILQMESVEERLVEALFYQNSKNTKIQNLQIVNKYIQDKTTNINITTILNGKLKDAFMRIQKNKNNYWEVLEFKVY